MQARAYRTCCMGERGLRVISTGDKSDSDHNLNQTALLGHDASAPRSFVAHSRVFARLASLAQIGELARRLGTLPQSRQRYHSFG